MTSQHAKQTVKATTPGPDHKQGQLKDMGGSLFDDFNSVLGNQAFNCLWMDNSDSEGRDKQIQAALATLIGIKPRNEIEGMLAAQLIASHSAAMECYRRAMISEQSFEGRKVNLSQANKLSTTFTRLLEALNRQRGKGQQKVTVEHVHVHEGGQAIVGSVEHGGGSEKNRKQQPHAKAVTHAPQPAMRCEDPERATVPRAGHEERPLSNARG